MLILKRPLLRHPPLNDEYTHPVKSSYYHNVYTRKVTTKQLDQSLVKPLDCFIAGAQTTS